jgi:hypothetical protein
MTERIYRIRFCMSRGIFSNEKGVSFSKSDFGFLLKALTKQTSMSYSAIIL